MNVTEFQAFVQKQVMSVGYSAEVAHEIAWSITTIVIDQPAKAELAPHVVLSPRATFLTMHTGGINSDRIRNNLGVTIVFDMMALRRRFEEGER